MFNLFGKDRKRGKVEGSGAGKTISEGAERPGKTPFIGVAGSADRSKGKTGDEVDGTSPSKNTRELETEKGPILVENHCPAEKLERMEVDDGICMFSRHDPSRQLKALVSVSKDDGGNVVVGVHDGKLVSFVGIHYPAERERWGKPGYPWLLELGAIEVSRNYRKLGLAEAMLGVAFDDPYYDDKILLTTGFTWHWDLEGTGMDKMQYRSLGISMFGHYGFMEMATDEPNVTMDSANLFLVRIGEDASFSRYQRFASLLFANKWEAVLRGF
ncbi:MAG: N-acetyltransferase [Actinobacteria bacterium]|nr:N-acetyltransferase [Actinomycetota bacterium]MCG2818104.1 N-acetyltransferase [Actinomycetes bacterium]MBU4217633.1 N-acetyltransferase [Actinomycetota bacterium]MBU4359696.1 N-acetyltransferase [Actinomycetota bacterium]MBU4393226.1 N-acetyltransferase [Actinomycetota bacterium]